MRMTEVPMLNTAVQHPPSLDEDFLAAALCRLYHVQVRRESLFSWMSKNQINSRQLGLLLADWENSQRWSFCSVTEQAD